ncbi:hypothetical protein AAG906_002020 [Vitis piasezkii]
MEEPQNKLASWVLEPKQRLKMMFVVGMAGLGRRLSSTACMRGVQNQTRNLIELVSKEIWLFNYTGADMVAVTHELQKFLRNKRCVESIRLALPDDNNSRIIITTRRGDIANSCRDNDSIHIHKLQPLSWENAKQLFHDKAFSRNSICPSGLEELSKSILQKCDGLPLGITEIGRLLKSRAQTAYEWQKLHDSLESELRSGGGLSNMMKVLSASYKDLHYHLKCCFLYMGIFPENKPVKRRRLVRLWIAERFVTEERGKTLEEVGEEYLNELIDRSLIQANEMDFDGRPKSEQKNFTEKTRRLSIQKKDFDISQELPCLRTFFSFSTGHFIGSLPECNNRSSPLEVLEFEEYRYKKHPETVSNLQQLETLDLKQTRVKKLPKSVLQLGELRHLLVCRYNNGRVVSFDAVQGSRFQKISALKNLQKLSFVKARWQYRMIEELQHLTQLRKLGIVALEKKMERACATQLKRCEISIP